MSLLTTLYCTYHENNNKTEHWHWAGRCGFDISAWWISRDISSFKWYKECRTGAPQQSPWQQWLLIPKQVKQQWITSNQAQSTEGVIMHTVGLLSLCKASLFLSFSFSLFLKVLWAEWLICNYWFLENVGGIEREREKEGRGLHPVFWVAPRCSARLRSLI